MKGTIYIAQRDRDGIIKLGYTTRELHTRFGDHGKRKSSTITLVGEFEVENVQAVERDILQMFSEKLVEGKEWFCLSDADIDRIAKHLNASTDWRKLVRFYQYKPQSERKKFECMRCGRTGFTCGSPKRCWLCKSTDWNVPVMCCGKRIVPPKPIAGAFTMPKLICPKCRQPRRTPQRTEK